MKKNTMKTNINQIRTISSRMPKTITEAINFNETDDMDMDMMDIQKKNGIQLHNY